MMKKYSAAVGGGKIVASLNVSHVELKKWETGDNKGYTDLEL